VESAAARGKKARILLRAAPPLAAYVPVDICLRDGGAGSGRTAARFPADQSAAGHRRYCFRSSCRPKRRRAPARVGFFPGSTIGNFEPHEAAAFLRNAAQILGKGSTIIIGVDLIKSADILNAAYNDKGRRHREVQSHLLVLDQSRLRGHVQARLLRASRLLQHRERDRIEMHLASLKRQKVRVAGETIEFRAGETILHRREQPTNTAWSLWARWRRERGLGTGGRLDRQAQIFLGPRPSLRWCLIFP